MRHLLAALLLAAGPLPGAAAEDVRRASLWIDLVAAEPIAYAPMVDELATARVIYLGERHTLLRHHEIQARLLTDLAGTNKPLVLALEQIEAVHQPAVDRFNRGQLDFAGLAAAIEWSRRWPGYEQYRPVLEAARRHGTPVLALNARAETIRQVARGGGLANLAPPLRKELPAEVQLQDPPYEKLLRLHMPVHAAATPQRLRPMIEAQIARDEMMAHVLAGYLQSPPGRARTALVICGAGHVMYGQGTAARLERRMPGLRQRIVLLSESGDVELSPAEKAASRPIAITHQQLRELGRPAGDYLHATAIRRLRLEL